MQHPAARESGFTLLEVLVTLVVLGLLMVTLTQGTRVALRAWAMDGNMAQRVNGLETTDRALRQLIERALPQDLRSNDGGLVGDAHTLSFATILPEGYGARSTHEADVSLRVSSDHRLELLWRPHYSRWIVQPPAPSVIPLVDGVERLDVGYLEPGSQGRWSAAWPKRALPPLVRLRIVFPAGDERHWPDIVIAPMRDPLAW
jgi:general secretion pathway protein J